MENSSLQAGFHQNTARIHGHQGTKSPRINKHVFALPGALVSWWQIQALPQSNNKGV
jgi:hypothetical protein